MAVPTYSIKQRPRSTECDLARGELHRACMSRLLPCPYQPPYVVKVESLRLAALDNYTWQEIRTRLGIA